MKRNVIDLCYCSFCGKCHEEVEYLLRARKEDVISICTECVDLCNRVIADVRQKANDATDGSDNV